MGGYRVRVFQFDDCIGTFSCAGRNYCRWLVHRDFLCIITRSRSFNLLIAPGTFSLFEMFLSIAFCGFGLLLVIGMFYLTKGLIKLFIRYLKFNINLVKGGLKDE